MASPPPPSAALWHTQGGPPRVRHFDIMHCRFFSLFLSPCAFCRTWQNMLPGEWAQTYTVLEDLNKDGCPQGSSGGGREQMLSRVVFVFVSFLFKCGGHVFPLSSPVWCLFLSPVTVPKTWRWRWSHEVCWHVITVAALVLSCFRETFQQLSEEAFITLIPPGTQNKCEGKLHIPAHTGVLSKQMNRWSSGDRVHTLTCSHCCGCFMLRVCVVGNKGVFEGRLLQFFFVFFNLPSLQSEKSCHTWTVVTQLDWWDEPVFYVFSHFCVWHFHHRLPPPLKKVRLIPNIPPYSTCSLALLFMLVVLTREPPFSLTAKPGSAHKMFLPWMYKTKANQSVVTFSL